MVDAVDWGLAAGIGTRLVGGGPNLSSDEAADIVAELYDLAAQAAPLVQHTTGLRADLPSEVRVVDRPEWLRSNIDGFKVVTEPLSELVRSNSSPVVRELGARATGAQVGLVLAFVGSKVLGQFEIFTGEDQLPRLLLVAPNIVEVQRQLGVDARDFRLWVCVHEQTHRIQFAAAPWLGDYLLSQIHEYLRLSDLPMSEVLGRMKAAVGVVSGRSKDPDGVVGAMQSPAQREIFDRMTAVMSLLEGHADVVMDAVGPRAIPTVVEIRRLFQQRRAEGATGWDGVLRRILGMDVKARQYAQGAEFVRAVLRDRGMAGLNVVWTDPQLLPTRAEIEDPALWLARV